MRKKNVRMMVGGFLLLALGVGFYVLMLSLTGQSNDPVEMMRVAGQASGVAGGIGVALIITGFIGKKE